MKRFICFVLAMALLLLCACESPPSSTSNTQLAHHSEDEQWADIDLYFLSSDVGSTSRLIEKESRSVKLETEKTMEELVLAEWMKGPTTARSQNVLSKEAQLLDVQKKGETLLVVLNKEAQSENPAEAMLLKNMIVLTMVELEGISQVGVYFGEVMRDTQQNIIGIVSERDIVSEDIKSKTGQRTITIYQPNQERSGLIERKVTIQTSINESTEKTVVDELFRNQQVNGMSSTVFNTNAKLVSSFVEGDIFFLNFSEPIFKEQVVYEEAYLSLYALVNTISDLQPIKRVQVLIKGKPDGIYGEIFDESYFEKNEELVIEQ